MTQLTSLSTWLLQDGNQPVAIHDDLLITKAQLCEKVAYWQACLPLSPGQKWAVYHSDAIEFLAIMFALWQSNCTACIPGDICAATTNRLNTSVTGFLGEFEDNFIPSATDLNAPRKESKKALDLDFPAIEVYTSGSTGQPKAIIKTLRQMDSELVSIDILWPFSASSILLSTVTHQHLFGLTFRLFWPLAKGQLFQAKYSPFTEDIYQQASQYNSFILISTPAHLSRLNKFLDWSSLKGKCEATISSAAALKYADSLNASKLLGAPIFEIYGSSETGAIAWRCQSDITQDHWTLLPGITLHENHSAKCFSVKGDHISHEYQTLSDNLERLSVDRFRLHGRVDRIVKVEGKRLSLSSMEICLEENRWVRTAKVLVITRKREEVAVVIELNDQGWAQVAQHSEKWLSSELKTSLKSSFESVLLPRRWRFVKNLPYNQQGKLPMDSLVSVFQETEIKWPSELQHKRNDQRCEFTFHIPPKLIYFNGHFENNPILPGIVQIHWAEHFGRKVFEFSGQFTRLEAIKFQQVVFPDSNIELKLEYHPDTQKLTFQYMSGKGEHSSGRICFN